MIKIAPSILSADFRSLEAEIKKAEAAGADMIHIDVMDGHFVPNITVGPLVVGACRKITQLPLDVHLMIENPDRYIPDFARAGADIITVQAEASKNLESDIALIKQNNVSAGVVVNPATPIESIFHVLDKISMVLLMTVNPGFEGQKFMREVLPKIQKLRSELKNKGLEIDIEVDGGINSDTAKEASKAGANVLVAGSAIFYSNDYKKAICDLKTI